MPRKRFPGHEISMNYLSFRDNPVYSSAFTGFDTLTL